MTNHIDPKQIAKAKEWAETVNHYDDTYNREELTIAGLIANLPDQIIDAEKVRDVINHHRHIMHQGLENDLEALITSPLLTLADLIERGHDPAQYQWGQAEHRDKRCIIIRINDQASPPTVSLLTATGATIWTSTDEVIPLPDLPCLVWPAELNPEPAEEAPNDSTEPQVGEAWLVSTREGEQREALKAGNRWYVKDGDDVEEWVEEALAPIARLVPEVQE